MTAPDTIASARTRGPFPSTAHRPAGIGLAGIGCLVAAAMLLAASPQPAGAQGWIDPLPRTTDWGVVKLRTDVTVRVDGRVAHVEVEEWFENRGGRVAEGDYLYPLPGEAVFSDFSLYQGDRELRGETMDADRARAIYEEIVRSRRDPALIELVGHGLVRARVFPFEPGERRRITLRYTQVLDRAGDAVQFRYLAGRANRQVTAMPRPLRPRFPGPIETRTHAGPGGPAAEVPVTFTLIADAGAYGRPFSPTHTLDVERDDSELRVRPAGALHGGFSVFLPLLRPVVGLALATHRPSREPGYFMLTLSPGEVSAAATPRDITAVVDVSGSMAGEKMEQTRQALHQLLASLGPRDRFRLISFSTGIATSSDTWSGAAAAELAAARAWVDGLRARGGTNIAGALEEAFVLSTPEDRLPIVVFMTDGLPTVGERDPDRIAAMAEARRGRARVFAFGVGFDVNTYLLDRFSAAGRGSTAYVEPGQDVEVVVGGLAARITHPVLTDLEILGSPARLTEIYPLTMPDLFAGEELVLFGRYEDPGAGELRVRGRRAGRSETFALTAELPARATANEFIPRLWAARKLGELTRQVRLHGADPELVEEIRQTALRYGLLSDYTAHLVQEPTVVARPGVPGNRNPLVVTGAARAPASVTGAMAVRSAESARLRREVASASDLVAAEAAIADMAVGPGAVGSGRRMVGGRLFERRDDAWVQTPDPNAEEVREVPVRLYSPAFFALMEALPELRPIITELEMVRVTGERITFRFGDDGRDRMAAGEVARLAAEFRGR